MADSGPEKPPQPLRAYAITVAKTVPVVAVDYHSALEIALEFYEEDGGEPDASGCEIVSLKGDKKFLSAIPWGSEDSDAPLSSYVQVKAKE
jgi:hypothetical protein